MLDLENISLQKHDKQILQEVSLTIKAGECVGLAGASGGGKSTLLRCIQGLEKPTQGSITVNGDVGFLFQDFQLFPHFTVLHNVFYPASLHKKNITEEDALHLLHKLGVEHLAQRLPHELSGGQKQRVALARSLFMQPQVLLCDEPTSGLDIRSTERVSEMLRTASEEGVTMLIASHEIPFLLSLCSRILVVAQGKLVQDIGTKHCSEEVLYSYY